jgi:NhaP-type Na+/H+ and K+/H+ antiporter
MCLLTILKEDDILNNFEKQKEKWEKIKSKGKRRYILQIVGICEITGLFCGTIIQLVDKHPAPDILSMLIVVVFYLICWGLAGIFIGSSGWNKQSQKFDK